MFDVLETRIKEITKYGKPVFKKVLTAVDESVVIENGTLKYDAAFLIDTGESAVAPYDTTQLYSQQFNQNFAVVIAVRSLNDRLGTNVNTRLSTLKDALRSSLLGWTPDIRTYNEISFVRAELVTFVNGGAFWLEEYTTDYTYRGNQ